MFRMISCILVGLLPLFSSAQQVSVGLGHYNLTPRAGSPSNSSGTAVMPAVTPAFSQPTQTNDWWSSLLWKYYGNQTFNWEIHSWKLFPHPLGLQANRYGLRVYYPDQVTVTDNYGYTNARYRHDMPYEDFTVGVTGMDLGVTDTVKVDNYGDWHVTASWDDGGGNTLLSTMSHGSPYCYFTKTGGDAYVRFLYGFTIDNTIGSNVIGITHNGHHYGIFFPTGSTYYNTNISHDENAFVANPPNVFLRSAIASDLGGNDYFSIALLPDNSLATLQEYATHAFAFISNTEVSWVYDESNALLTTQFNISTTPKEGTEARTLTALYRHQWLNSNDINASYTYASPRGTMKVFKGNAFSTTLRNNGIIPNMPLGLREIDSMLLFNYVEDERQVDNAFVTTEDTYWMGKRLSRQSELAWLADEVGHTVARDEFLLEIKTELEDWFQADDGETDRGYFYYDNNWNTMIGVPVSYGTDTNLNDHHFHYGYFLKAVATVAQFDPDWASAANWGGMAELLIKDVANADRTDTRFPFLRYLDPYAGHSWANGHANFHFGNDQESSSEAMNFAASVFLLGRNTHDTALRDLGIYLYLTEASAVEQYWFDQDAAVFPMDYPYVSAARIWGDGAEKVDGNQPFELEPEYMLGINALPLDGASLYLGRDAAYVQVAYNELVSMNGGLEDNLWDDLVWCYQAMADPTAALAKYDTHTAPVPYNTNLPWIPSVSGIYEPLSGEAMSPAQTFTWLHVLDSLGQVDASVWANHPSAMAFMKDGIRRYVLSLPPPPVGGSMGPVTVSFSDGTNVTANPGDFIIYDPNALLPVELLDFSANYEGGRIRLDWQTASEVNTDAFVVERSLDGRNFQEIGKVNALYSNGGDYRCFDEIFIKNQLIYYRLQIVDEDGTWSHSPVRAVRAPSITDIQVFPNPVEDGLLHIRIAEGGVWEAELYDIRGVRHVKWRHTRNSDPVDLRHLPAGNYVLRLSNGMGNTVFRLTK